MNGFSELISFLQYQTIWKLYVVLPRCWSKEPVMVVDFKLVFVAWIWRPRHFPTTARGGSNSLQSSWQKAYYDNFNKHIASFNF